MKESSTYQAILAEGRAEGRAEGQVKEARRFLLKLGKKQFGPPDPATQAALNAITKVEQLERLGEGLFAAGSWQELLAPPRRGRRKSDR
jgi:hypothetical protein